MTRIRPRLAMAISGLVLTSSLLIAPHARADPAPDPANGPTPAFTIDDPRITESSGLTRDTGNNLYWTVNDSGDKGVVYALGPDGRTRGTLEYAAKPVDVEAVLMVGNRLYVGDIGDNERKRSKITVYYFDNPVPNDKRSGSYRSYDFVYPDGPRDAEAMLVDRQGRLLFVSKEAEGSIYAAPRQLRTDTPNMLTRVARGPSFVTDGAVLPDGRLVLRSYVAVEVVSPDIFGTVARAPLPFQRQGESIAVSLDGTSLLVGSEGANSTVLTVPIPGQLQVAPTPQASPPPSPAPSPTAEPVAEPVESGDQSSRAGTVIALLLALLVSMAAAAVVFLRGRGPAGATRAAEDPGTRTEGAGEVVARRAAGPVPPPAAPTSPGDPIDPNDPLGLFAAREPVRPARGIPDLGRPLDQDEPTMVRRLSPDERPPRPDAG